MDNQTQQHCNVEPILPDQSQQAGHVMNYRDRVHRALRMAGYPLAREAAQDIVDAGTPYTFVCHKDAEAVALSPIFTTRQEAYAWRDKQPNSHMLSCIEAMFF